LLISNENISLPAIIVNGVSSPNALAMAIAIAVLPVPGYPANNIALPAILPSLIICRMIPAPFLASFCPTNPYETFLASKVSSKPNPLICECADILSILVMSFTSSTFVFKFILDIFYFELYSIYSYSIYNVYQYQYYYLPLQISYKISI